VSQWKRQLLEEGAGVFGENTARQQREQETREAELYEQIGRLKMELEWLKKNAARVSWGETSDDRSLSSKHQCASPV